MCFHELRDKTPPWLAVHLQSHPHTSAQLFRRGRPLRPGWFSGIVRSSRRSWASSRRRGFWDQVSSWRRDEDETLQEAFAQQKCRSAEVQKCRSAEVQKCRSAGPPAGTGSRSMAPAGRGQEAGNGGAEGGSAVADGEGGDVAVAREAVMMRPDTLLLLLRFLPPRDILRCAAVCSLWSRVIRSAPAALWRCALRNLPGHSQPAAGSSWPTPRGAGRAQLAGEGGALQPPSCGSKVTGEEYQGEGSRGEGSQGEAPQGEASQGEGSLREGSLREGSHWKGYQAASLRCDALQAEAVARWSHGTPVVTSLEAHVGRATCVKRKAGVVVSGGVDEMVCVWDVSGAPSSSGRPRRAPPGRLLHLRSPCQRPIADVDATETLLLAASGSVVLVWSRPALDQPGAPPQLRKALGGHHQAVERLAHEDTLVAAACADGTLHVFDLYAGSVQQILRPHRRAATCVSLDASASLLLSGGGDGAAVLHDLRASRAVRTLLPPWKASGWVASVQLLGPGQARGSASSLGAALVGTSRGDVLRWDLRQGQVQVQGSERAAERRVCGREPEGGLLVGLAVPPWDALPRPLLALSASSLGELQVLELASLRSIRHVGAREWQAPTGRVRGSKRAQGRSAGAGLSAPWHDLVGSSSGMRQPQGTQGQMVPNAPARQSASGKGITGLSASWGALALSHIDGTVSLVEFNL